MQSSSPDNANPTVYATQRPSRATRRQLKHKIDFFDDREWHDKPIGHHSSYSNHDQDLIDSEEIFDLIRSITDPEHPLTLEQLAVVSADQIHVTNGTRSHVLVEFTPTIPHCSMATLIGLSLRVRLLRALPERFKVDIRVKPGTHQSENAVNKQLNDKERVAAALENNHLLNVVQQCLATADNPPGHHV